MQMYKLGLKYKYKYRKGFGYRYQKSIEKGYTGKMWKTFLDIKVQE